MKHLNAPNVPQVSKNIWIGIGYCALIGFTLGAVFVIIVGMVVNNIQL